MLPPLIHRPRRQAMHRNRERGVTLALVALSIVGVISMAALSIDVGTLYQASSEAQRSADAAALAAARVLSLSGITGDPTNAGGHWADACTAAQQAARTVATQNTVGGAAPTSVTVTFLSSDGSNCASTGNVAFGANPMATIKVTRSTLPTFFAHVFGLFSSNWNTASVSGSATAEVFNPSESGNYASGGALIPVQPKCVKPWIVPNRDPGTGSCVAGGCQPFVFPGGFVVNQGIQVGGSGSGVIGETFNLIADCSSTTSPCTLGPPANNPPLPNATGIPPSLQYVPGLISSASSAAPSCATNPYQQAVAGCDQTTTYQCGVQNASATPANQVDLTENPSGPAGDTSVAVQCLIREAAPGSAPSGQDTLDTSVFPYRILGGSSNPLGISTAISSSNSIVSLPIYDGTTPLVGTQPPVTIMGFLQVFIRYINPDGSLIVTVLNVAGCGNGVVAGSPSVTGTSPVPVRLITPP